MPNFRINVLHPSSGYKTEDRGRSPETLISIYQTTWRHILEQSIIQYYGRLKTVKVLKTYISTKAWFQAKQIRCSHTDFLTEWKLHWNSVHL